MRSKTTGLKLTFTICATVLFWGPSVTLAESSILDGDWTTNFAVSTGIISDSYTRAVDPLEGTRIVIQHQHLWLSNDVSCLILSGDTDVWVNDRQTFGSFGGDWSDVGLVSTDGQHFHVTRYDLECPHLSHPKLSLIVQPAHNVVLLGAFRVFVKLLPSG